MQAETQAHIETIKTAIDLLRKLPRTIYGKPIEVLAAGVDVDLGDLPMKVVNAGYIEDRRKLAQFFSASDVTLAPSLAKTFSNTVHESLSCGTTVAGFKTGAIPEMAQGDRGSATDLGDIIGLAEIVQRVLSREDKRVEACHAFVLNHMIPSLLDRNIRIFS